MQGLRVELSQAGPLPTPWVAIIVLSHCPSPSTLCLLGKSVTKRIEVPTVSPTISRYVRFG